MQIFKDIEHDHGISYLHALCIAFEWYLKSTEYRQHNACDRFFQCPKVEENFTSHAHRWKCFEGNKKMINRT